VATDGIQEDFVRSGLFASFTVDVESDGQYAYTTEGDLIDLTTLQRAGTYPVRGVVRPDAAKGRVHFFENGVLRTYHNVNQNLIGTLSVAPASGATVMIRWGSDGLAFRTASQIILIRSALIGP
jgi:hypothetical protein